MNLFRTWLGIPGTSCRRHLGLMTHHHAICQIKACNQKPDGTCRFSVITALIALSRFHVFTCRILGERFATLPPSHRSTHRGALGLRGAPPGSAPMHYLRTHTGQGHGRQAGQAADRRKRHSQAEGPALQRGFHLYNVDERKYGFIERACLGFSRRSLPAVVRKKSKGTFY